MIAGEFWEDKNDYLKMIENLALDDVILIDDRYIPNEEVAVYFSAADALAAPYRLKTGSGVSQLANAFNLPVIAVPTVNGSSSPRQETGSERVEQVAIAVIDFFQHVDPAADAGIVSATSQVSSEASIDPTWKLLLDTIENCAGGPEIDPQRTP